MLQNYVLLTITELAACQSAGHGSIFIIQFWLVKSSIRRSMIHIRLIINSQRHKNDKKPKIWKSLPSSRNSFFSWKTRKCQKPKTENCVHSNLINTKRFNWIVPFKSHFRLLDFHFWFWLKLSWWLIIVNLEQANKKLLLMYEKIQMQVEIESYLWRQNNLKIIGEK